MSKHIIYNFNKTSNIKNWVVVDDIVMGGKSIGTFELSEEGNGIFKGNVSLENNGGFSSVKYKFSKIHIENATVIILRIKGDGKIYQFRLKANSVDKHSYITKFSTTYEWQEIEIPIQNMYPSFRGKKLNIPNFSEEYVEEIAFLIANKSDESFELAIDSIELK